MPVRIPMLFFACLPLTACLGSNAAGVRIEPLPASIAAPCPHPSRHLSTGDWEIMAGRLGDDLLACGAKLTAAVKAYEAVREAVGE